MKQHDREWFLAAISDAQESVDEARRALLTSIERGELIIAQIHCDTLKSRLAVLDKSVNQYNDHFEKDIKTLS